METRSSPVSSRPKQSRWSVYVRWSLKVATAVTVLGVAAKTGHLEFQSLKLLFSLFSQ